MHCPVCKKAMVVMEWQAVEIDHCLKCRGIWLDSGELDLLVTPGEKDRRLSIFRPAEGKDHPQRKCPICRKRMKQVTAGEGTIVLDECVQGHGLWFDADELEKVLSLKEVNADGKVKDFLKGAFDRK